MAITLKGYPSEQPKQAWTLEVWEADVSAEVVSDELLKVATVDGQRELPAPNSLQVRESRTNWGASGAGGEYILAVSANLLGGVGTVAFTSAVQSVFRRIKERVGDSSPATLPSHAEASQLVRSHIELHYDESADALVEVSSSTDLESGIHEFLFKASSGAEYGAKVGEINGAARCTRLWRVLPEADEGN